MTQNPREMEQYKKELVEVFMEMAENKKALADLLEDILTPGEFREVATRWQIIKKLKGGEGQRDIAHDLGIGVATVNRGARMLLNPEGGFSQALRRIGR